MAEGNPNDVRSRSGPPCGRPLRVAYLTRRFPILSQTFVIGEIEDHLRAGLDVQILCTRSEAEADFPASRLDPLFRGRVHYLDCPRGNDAVRRALLRTFASRPWAMPAGLRAAAFLKEEKGRYAAMEAALVAMRLAHILPRFDLLHCHFGNIGILGAAVVRSARVRPALVTTFHGYDVTRDEFLPLADYYRLLFRAGSLMLCVNGIWRDRLVGAGADPGATLIHHMGVDLDELAFRHAAPGARAGLLRIAMVGRLTEKKGHRTALDAVAALRERRPDLDLRLDIVGGGDLQSDVEERIRGLRLEPAVVLRGPMSHADSLALVAEADAFLLPSVTAADGDMEGIPVSLMEAMALGRPVVSTRHSGIPELIEDGRSGLLADEHDHRAVSECLERLADDPGLGRRLAEAGRRRVEDEFNAERQGERLRDRYRFLVRSRIATRGARA